MSPDHACHGVGHATSGAHFVGLDHVRALACFLVFVWHFTHGQSGSPLPFESNAAGWAFPLALADEGHVGVSLFMVLSGYLFSRLIGDRGVHYGLFLWNRTLRLLPLLAVVVVVVGWQRWASGGPEALTHYAREVLRGWYAPTLPNGGWSITVELHFYLLLPVLMWVWRRSAMGLVVLLGLMLVLRTAVYWHQGTVQELAYLTLLGRADQFLCGMLAARFAAFFRARHALALLFGAGFALYYWSFAQRGGLFHLQGFPSRSAEWVLLPALEGVALATLVAWYDQSFTFRMEGVSGAVARVGQSAYGIYLLHPFWVFSLAPWVHQHVLDMSQVGWAMAAASVAFTVSAPVGWASLRWFESPFMRLRRPYLKDRYVA